ncbi:ATP-dependent RNA helicase HAS1 [Spironucleus salmonicida]|uniref:ATP-dependent RNA helicase n=1 Tax=Spironucleus salmonicida TaxID=348837 RepID=V6LBR0_9EUKA|nr:ATP-dependent RNA helicase HAS1 [Spironucleus salmonicida]|eukprot:EST41653.1 ATP-dependent RNA helicase HAS1 [Spironucleus salmonicida]
MTTKLDVQKNKHVKASKIQKHESDIMTTDEFKDQMLAPFLIEKLQEQGKSFLTKVQQIAIQPILAGKDVAVKAKTGSGKSLAFILPALDTLYRAGMKPRNGTGVIIITPTRELAIQLYDIGKELSQGQITVGLAVGGTSKVKEEQRLVAGASLVIGTPGRLRDHLMNTQGWKTSNLFQLILDEADMLLDYGFEEELASVLKLLPAQQTRQTCLFSATLSSRVLGIKNLTLKQDHLKLDADPLTKTKTRINFEQGYIICAPELRFLVLYTFLKKKKSQKIMVFMSTCAAVQFYSEFLKYVGMESVMSIQGKLKQSDRLKAYSQFIAIDAGILICTNVAARGLDIPEVDYVVQFDPPESVESYIHRAGRACRGDSTNKGTGVLFLMEHERAFVDVLVGASVPMLEFEFPMKAILNVSEEFKSVISTNYYLLKSAQEAFKSFIAAYASLGIKSIFDLIKIDLQKLAQSFGLPSAPRVDQVIQMYKARRKADERKSRMSDKKQSSNQFQDKDEISQDEKVDEK